MMIYKTMQQSEGENMKVKKKLIDRIGTFVCTLVVAVSCLVGSVPYYASTDTYFLNLSEADFEREYAYENYVNYGKNTIYIKWRDYEYMCRFGYSSAWYSSGSGYCPGVSTCAKYYKCDGVWIEDGYGGASSLFDVIGSFEDWYDDFSIGFTFLPSDLPSDMIIYTTTDFTYKYSNMSSYKAFFGYKGWSANYEELKYGKYNADLGYLQNIHKQLQYLRGSANVGGVDLPLYTYDVDDSLKYVWTHDTTSSKGVDLTSGNYAVRHYITKATVTGYEKKDIIEESEMYLMDEYDASLGRFEYMETDYDAKLEAYDYDGLSWIEKYLQGRFLLTHHYFQIVNLDTNEVGGYLHVYPKDADGANAFEQEGNFGVEDVYEALDNDLNVDENGPGGYSEGSVGHGTTYEEAEEDAKEEDLKLDLSGVDDFGNTMVSLSSQVGAVSSAVGSIIGLFPPWVTMILALSIALLVLVFVIKMMRG